MEKIKTKIINKLMKISLIGIAIVFYTSVWRGYKEYCRLKKKVWEYTYNNAYL